ncbi:unnamed protein product [Mytilus coruscus]|uniref:Uncharacterized protein n=1 Tax=Mytilus coruscus TaxID=42192 RepID=A0A6J8BQ64_MYTCO|nr:unnamed protein product [Mytilus coruscus]
MPFGEKKMKLPSGKIIPTPNVIRCIAPAAIVMQYDQYCEENDIEKLSCFLLVTCHSTLYRIMQVCPASVQKSMEGLDYFVVEGGRAYEDLLWVVNQLHLFKEEMDQMIKDLSECKQYLKHDFKIHMEEKNDIKDHCMTFYLNDKDLHFKNECCNHQHLSGYPKCLQLSDLLEEIIKRVQILESENIEDMYDEILFKTSNAIDNTVEWKKQIVRSKNQLRTKNHIMSALNGSKAIVMLDWAI